MLSLAKYSMHKKCPNTEFFLFRNHTYLVTIAKDFWPIKLKAHHICSCFWSECIMSHVRLINPQRLTGIGLGTAVNQIDYTLDFKIYNKTKFKNIMKV